MSLRLAVDFDLCMVEATTPLKWRPWAKETLKALFASGHSLILLSHRCTPSIPTLDSQKEAASFYRWGLSPISASGPWVAFAEMRTFLKAEEAWELFEEVWTHPGKPTADLFIDGKAEKPNWANLINELGIS